MTDWQTYIDKARHDPRSPTILTAIISIMLIFTVWDMISDFIPQHKKITAAQTQPIQPLTQVANLHIFGVYSSTLQALPATRLTLTLEGTAVVLDAPTQSRALITANQITKVYQVGDTISSNATITHIAKHHVVINDNGALEKLSLPIETLDNTP